MPRDPALFAKLSREVTTTVPLGAYARTATPVLTGSGVRAELGESERDCGGHAAHGNHQIEQIVRFVAQIDLAALAIRGGAARRILMIAAVPKTLRRRFVGFGRS